MNHGSILGILDNLGGLSQEELLADAGETLAIQIIDLLASWEAAVGFLDKGDFISCAQALYDIRRTKMDLRSGKRDCETKAELSELREYFDKLINPLTGGKNTSDPFPSLEPLELSESLLSLGPAASA